MPWTAPTPPGTPPDVEVDGSPPGRVRLLTPEQALARDTEELAKTDGISLAEARHRMAFQERVDTYLQSVPTDVMENSFAGGEFTFSSTTGSTAVMHFKDDVPAAAKRGAPTGLRLRGGAKYSLNEMSARQNSAHQAIVDLGFTEVTSSADAITQKITVNVAQRPDRPGLRGEKLRTAALDSLAHPRRQTTMGARLGSPSIANEATPVSMTRKELVLREHPAGTRLFRPTHGYGGAGALVDGVQACTTGFVVRRNSDGVEGVTTAGHCERVTAIEENNASGGVNLTFPAPFAKEHIGVDGDIEWHTTTHDDFPRFWADTGTLRSVTGRKKANTYFVGEYVCKYGRVGGLSCGHIVSLSRSATLPGEGIDLYTAQNMIGVDYDEVEVEYGDSGGPWFVNNTAYGILSGYTNDGNGCVITFSKIQLVEKRFGVTVERA